jgi:hypothetical protein
MQLLSLLADNGVATCEALLADQEAVEVLVGMARQPCYIEKGTVLGTTTSAAAAITLNSYRCGCNVCAGCSVRW